MIWLSADRLARLKAKVAANDPDWLALQKECDTWIDQVPYGPFWYSYGLVYVLTGDPKYGLKAISLVQPIVDFGVKGMTQAVPGVTWISQTSQQGFNAREILPALAVTMDWCWNALTPAQRVQWPTVLTACTDWVWPETNPARAGAYAVRNPADNFFWGFMTSWIAGVALSSVSIVAGKRHCDLARSKYATLAVPYLLGNGRGGWFSEGCHYGSETRSRIFQIMDGVTTGTGASLSTIESQWLTDTTLSLIHETLPGDTHLAICGEQTGDDRSATINESARAAARIALNILQPPHSGYAQEWLQQVGQANINRWERWIPMLWNRNDIPAVSRELLPTGHYSPGAGRIVSRSSWKDDAVLVTTQCGPMESSHQDRANGGFLLYAGSPGNAPAALATSTHYTVGSQHTLDSRLGSGNNSLTVAGREQPELDPDLDAAMVKAGITKGSVLHYEDTPTYCYVVMEAAGSYAIRKWPGVDSPLSEWLRVLFFVKDVGDPYLLVFDRCTKAQAGVACTWNLNVGASPATPEDSWLVIDAKGRTADWEPFIHPLDEAMLTAVNLGEHEAISSWRIHQSGDAKDAIDRFASVFQVAPSGQVPGFTIENLIDESVLGKTCELACAVGTDALLLAPHTFPSSLTTDAKRLFVTGLVPGKSYHLTSLSETVSAVVSVQGVAVFETTHDGSSNRAVVLFEGSAPPPVVVPTPPVVIPTPPIVTPVPPVIVPPVVVPPSVSVQDFTFVAAGQTWKLRIEKVD